jgi:hypothetical protein
MAHSPALVSFLDLTAARSAKRYPPELDRPSDPPRTIAAAAAAAACSAAGSFRLAQPAQPALPSTVSHTRYRPR